MNMLNLNIYKKIVKTNLETTAHKFWVLYYLTKISCKLIKRGLVHDLSKYSFEESFAFASSPNLKTYEYNSPEYLESIKNIEKALTHHYKLNSHHPQYHKNGISDMSFLDIIEMLADWKSSTKRTKNGSIENSIKINRERFWYSRELEKLLNNLAGDL